MIGILPFFSRDFDEDARISHDSMWTVTLRIKKARPMPLAFDSYVPPVKFHWKSLWWVKSWGWARTAARAMIAFWMA
jgi:hypothetical protein